MVHSHTSLRSVAAPWRWLAIQFNSIQSVEWPSHLFPTSGESRTPGECGRAPRVRQCALVYRLIGATCALSLPPCRLVVIPQQRYPKLVKFPISIFEELETNEAMF